MFKMFEKVVKLSTFAVLVVIFFRIKLFIMRFIDFYGVRRMGLKMKFYFLIVLVCHTWNGLLIERSA